MTVLSVVWLPCFFFFFVVVVFFFFDASSSWRTTTSTTSTPTTATTTTTYDSYGHRHPLPHHDRTTRRGDTSSTTTTTHRRNVTRLDCGMRELALDYAIRTMTRTRTGRRQRQGRQGSVSQHRKNSVDDDRRLSLLTRHVHDALRLEALCGISPPPTPTTISISISTLDNDNSPGGGETSRRTRVEEEEPLSLESIFCKDPHICLHVATGSDRSATTRSLRHDNDDDKMDKEDGTPERPFTSIHDAIEESRKIRRRKRQTRKRTAGTGDITIVLGKGIHELHGRTIHLTHLDNGLSIRGHPDEHLHEAWLSGGIPLVNVTFDPSPEDSSVYIGNLTEILKGYELPHILSLFSTDRRWTRARYPNAHPETDQWGYASPNRLQHSISSQEVLEWHLPPKGIPPNFTWVDFQETSPPGVPRKNNSKQRGYNWYASGQGGVCAEVWGPQADSYWCSNASQGGWAEVDKECATTGQSQLPIGLTYNTTLELSRFQHSHHYR